MVKLSALLLVHKFQGRAVKNIETKREKTMSTTLQAPGFLITSAKHSKLRKFSDEETFNPSVDYTASPHESFFLGNVAHLLHTAPMMRKTHMGNTAKSTKQLTSILRSPKYTGKVARSSKDSDTFKENKKVHFAQKRTIKNIPRFDSYTMEEKSRMWRSTSQIRADAETNTFEWYWEGRKLRGVLEEKDFRTDCYGNKVHPARLWLDWFVLAKPAAI